MGKPAKAKHKNYNCLAAYVGLLCQGKTAYEDVREMFEDVFFYSRALKIDSIPSAETLRQRLDYLGKELFEGSALQQANIAMLNASDAEISACFSGHFPLDVDVSVHDNSNTKKEGVQYTYKGVDGYAPIYAYLGLEGYMVGA